MTVRSLCRLAAVLVAFLGGPAAAQWKAGVAKISITPSEPIWLGGFAGRNRPSEGVRQDIHVKALALQDETGALSVLVTADLVDSKRDVWDVVAERCEKQFGISRERLALNESHTHSAPVVLRRPLIPLFCPLLDKTQEAVVRRYTAGFVDKAVEAVGQAIRNLAPATLAFGQNVAGIAVNRRRVWMQRSLPGPVDPDVPVLSVRDASGGLIAVVVGYACHATSLSDYQVSGDWPGYAQAELEKAHPGVIAMFVQGCGADANALPRSNIELAQGYGRILAAAVEEVLGSKRRMRPLLGGIQAAFERVDVPFEKPPSREELQTTLKTATGIDRRHAERLLLMLDRDGKLMEQYPYPVQVWQFGSGLKMLFLGGEVVVDYALRLKAQHGWESTWVAGYSNDVFTYVPSLRVLKEGGYEGADAIKWEDLPSPFQPAIEEIIVGKVKTLVDRTAPRK